MTDSFKEIVKGTCDLAVQACTSAAKDAGVQAVRDSLPEMLKSAVTDALKPVSKQLDEQNAKLDEQNAKLNKLDEKFDRSILCHRNGAFCAGTGKGDHEICWPKCNGQDPPQQVANQERPKSRTEVMSCSIAAVDGMLNFYQLPSGSQNGDATERRTALLAYAGIYL